VESIDAADVDTSKALANSIIEFDSREHLERALAEVMEASIRL
jgi:hypothetical protein